MKIGSLFFSQPRQRAILSLSAVVSLEAAGVMTAIKAGRQL